MNTKLITSDTTFCPLCHCKNSCEVTNQKGCWCMQVDVPPELLALLTNEQRGKSCICLNCINSYKLNNKLSHSL